MRLWFWDSDAPGRATWVTSHQVLPVPGAFGAVQTVFRFLLVRPHLLSLHLTTLSLCLLEQSSWESLPRCDPPPSRTANQGATLQSEMSTSQPHCPMPDFEY